eukprot:200067-Prymnesium_polylepis.2
MSRRSCALLGSHQGTEAREGAGSTGAGLRAAAAGHQVHVQVHRTHSAHRQGADGVQTRGQHLLTLQPRTVCDRHQE